MDVWLDEPVPIAEADGDHGVDSDPVGGQVTVWIEEIAMEN